MSDARMVLADGVALAARLLREAADNGSDEWTRSTEARDWRRAAAHLDAQIHDVIGGAYDNEIGRGR